MPIKVKTQPRHRPIETRTAREVNLDLHNRLEEMERKIEERDKEIESLKSNLGGTEEIDVSALAIKFQNEKEAALNDMKHEFLAQIEELKSKNKKLFSETEELKNKKPIGSDASIINQEQEAQISKLKIEKENLAKKIEEQLCKDVSPSDINKKRNHSSNFDKLLRALESDYQENKSATIYMKWEDATLTHGINRARVANVINIAQSYGILEKTTEGKRQKFVLKRFDWMTNS